jgi:hypothetical protein
MELENTTQEPQIVFTQSPGQPEFCDRCGHFHYDTWCDGTCPDPGVPCGSYLCCIND